MKIRILFLLVILSAGIYPCYSEVLMEILATEPASYEIKNDKAYHDGRLLEGSVDIKTFKVIDFNSAKDKNSVFIRANRIKNSSPETFVSMGNEYYKDKNRVYNFEGNVITGADPASFKILGGNFGKIYAKDKNKAYYGYAPIPEADAASFEFIGDSFAKDKYRIYQWNFVLDGADAGSFEILDHSYSRDKNKVFWQGKSMHGADPSAFVILGSSYSKDKSQVYHQSMIIEGADPASFIIMDSLYSKDYKNVFFFGKKIDGADVKTFKVLEGNYARDKEYLYIDGVQTRKINKGEKINMPDNRVQQ